MLGRSPGEGKGYLLQYTGLENSMGLYSPWGPKESDMTEQLSLRDVLGSSGGSFGKRILLQFRKHGFDPRVGEDPP